MFQTCHNNSWKFASLEGNRCNGRYRWLKIREHFSSTNPIHSLTLCKPYSLTIVMRKKSCFELLRRHDNAVDTQSGHLYKDLNLGFQHQLPAFIFLGHLLFIYLFLNFTLQYCIGFAIHWHESAMGIHVFPILHPSPSLYHPSGLSQCFSPKHPVSCIEPGLVIHFICDIIHVSMPFSQIIPPSPSPTESKRLFNTSVSLLLSHIQGYHLPSF